MYATAGGRLAVSKLSKPRLEDEELEWPLSRRHPDGTLGAEGHGGSDSAALLMFEDRRDRAKER